MIRVVSLRKALSHERQGYETSSQTDWAKVDAQTDNDIDTSDVPPLCKEWFERAQIRQPDGMLELRVRVEPAVFAWFSKQGEDGARSASAALAIYAAAHQSAAARPGQSADGPAEPANTRAAIENGDSTKP